MGNGQATPACINLSDVAIIRGNHLVLQQLSLAIGSGEIIWIRGANGCGKSTLLRVIAGLLPVASGSVEITGKIALADENVALDTNVTVENALRLWADMDNASGQLRDDAMVAMDLIPLANIPVGYLSSGQRRRAGLARVIASGAVIWLLDEPYNGLDSANTARLDTALLRHASSGGIALVTAHQAPSINVTASVSLDKLSPQSKSS